MELKKDLRKEIEEKIKKENITLLGQIEISDEDYEELKKDIVFYLDHLYMATVPQPNIRLAIVMVQVAIRHYRGRQKAQKTPSQTEKTDCGTVIYHSPDSSCNTWAEACKRTAFRQHGR